LFLAVPAPLAALHVLFTRAPALAGAALVVALLGARLAPPLLFFVGLRRRHGRVEARAIAARAAARATRPAITAGAPRAAARAAERPWSGRGARGSGHALLRLLD